MREHRSIIINGEEYVIPPRLYRIKGTQEGGWVVRYTKNKETVNRYFADWYYNSVANSYQNAMRYLTSEVLPIIYALPGLKEDISVNKQSDTPVGITGPLWRLTKKHSHYCVFQVTVPVAGQISKTRSVYIGNENTWQRNCDNALERAIEIRDDAVEEYKYAAEELRLDAIAELNGDEHKRIHEPKRPSYSDSRVLHIDFKRGQLLKTHIGQRRKNK